MTWRRIPPVASPISARSLVVGSAAAAGVLSAREPELEHLISGLYSGGHSGGLVRLTDSGTSALVAALRAALPALGVVAYPAFACIDLIAAAIRAGARVRLYDLDPSALGPDLDSLRAALRRGADAVVASPLFGYPIDHAALAAVAAEFSVPVIEDAAQGAGGTWRGMRIGTFGDVTVLSFGRGKGTTGGSGGAIIARGASMIARVEQQRFGRARRGARDVIALGAQRLVGTPALYAIPASIPWLQLGEMVYHEAGEPRAISVAAARIVPHALAADAAEVRARRLRAERLSAAVQRGDRYTCVRTVNGGESGFLRLAVLASHGRAGAAPRLGVLHAYPVTLDEHAVTARVLVDGERAGPGARVLADALYTAPTHGRLSAADGRRLERWLAGDGGR